ncbi:hypothetical protein [Reticulibacter mediterranei]|uniref:hypothetical protein n=1 Tax=Reticulibacter mediterranei TaxID=2778369 RepID=UPI001C691038|nr:hypothetical protein [Reticulibacter mediterranei]
MDMLDQTVAQAKQRKVIPAPPQRLHQSSARSCGDDLDTVGECKKEEIKLEETRRHFSVFMGRGSEKRESCCLPGKKSFLCHIKVLLISVENSFLLVLPTSK